MSEDTTAQCVNDDMPRWIQWFAGSLWGVTLLSALESTVLPIPLEAVLVPVMVSNPKRAIALGCAALVGCILGSLAAYGAAMFLLDPVVMPILGAVGLEQQFNEMEQRLTGESLFWVVFAISITPAPMQIATLSAGAVAGNILVFIAAIVASRAPRYLGLGLAARVIGPRILKIDLPTGRWTLILLGVILLGFLGWRLLDA